ncbi:MAG TPA: M1 family aminopeptidase [Candidatus Limnocylindria bacterium]|nr:M1 family aminopeptidase [Candidatus Limnocylindria bacterium]
MVLRAGTVASAACIACFVFLAGCVTDNPAVTHHDLTVRLDPNSNSLAALDTMTLRTAGQSSLAFVLSENAAVEKVAAGEKALALTFEGGTLRAALPPDLPGEGELSLTVSYRASFQDHVPEDPVNTEDPSYGVRETIGEKGTFLSGSAGWYPEIPGSRPTFRVQIEGPAGYEAVTAGRLVRRETSGDVTRSEWETRMPLDGLSLSAGPYRVREGTAGETKIYTYLYPGSDALSETYLAAAARYLSLYRERFGPYPFEKFAVVENFFPTGYGFPSYTLLGSTVIRLPFIVDTSLGHEVAHSWWGNGVLVDYRRGNWSEGLTTYVADYLYKERTSPEEGKEYRLKILRDYSTLVSSGNDFPLASFTGRDSPASRAIGYGKGAMVFHMARRLAGEEAFWEGLRDLVREKMFREVTWDDFADAFGRTSGTDFAPFIRQWVDQSGAPVVALKEVKAVPTGEGWHISGLVVQEQPYFDLRIPLRLVTDEENIDTVLHVSSGDTPLSLSAGAPPRKLVIDPDVDLFRRLFPSEIPPTVNAIRGSADLLVVAARGLPVDLLEASKTLLATMGRKDARLVREENTKISDLAGHDVLFLGLPAEKGYLPTLPPALSAGPSRFTVEGAAYVSPGNALFAVLPHPAGGGRVAALFLAFSPEAASQAARKIPHYGKYSYLAFSDGTAREKGTLEPLSSPLIWDFPAEAGKKSPKVPPSRLR